MVKGKINNLKGLVKIICNYAEPSEYGGQKCIACSHRQKNESFSEIKYCIATKIEDGLRKYGLEIVSYEIEKMFTCKYRK